MDIEWQWIAGVGLPIAILVFGVWWKVEARQDRNLADLQKCNHKDHQEIRKELAASKDLMNQQHHHLRDKLDNIWAHISKHPHD